jgi:hypothetical protein
MTGFTGGEWRPNGKAWRLSNGFYLRRVLVLISVERS